MVNKNSLIRLFKVSRKGEVYQIGCTARLLTIHAQQQRAFHFIRAIQSSVNSDQNIAVIGAGISGLSVSCGLMALGAKVYLYEKASDEIHLQRGNTTRFIHPNISNWPSIEYAYPYTHLPFLNWRSGTAGDITTQILEQWDVFLKRHKSQLKWNPNQNIERISGSGNKLFLHLNGEVHGSFEKVVIAAVYGLERKNFEIFPF